MASGVRGLDGPAKMQRLGVGRSSSRRAPTARYREGVAFAPFCHAEAAANALTNPTLDPIGKIPEFKYARRG